MKRRISLIILVIISFHLCGQNGTITINKNSESGIIVGQWIRIYDKKRNGTIFIPAYLDTINIYSQNKFIWIGAGTKLIGTWTFYPNEHNNIGFEKCRYEKKGIKETTYYSTSSFFYNINFITKDSLVLATGDATFFGVYNRYYIRNK